VESPNAGASLAPETAHYLHTVSCVTLQTITCSHPFLQTSRLTVADHSAAKVPKCNRKGQSRHKALRVHLRLYRCSGTPCAGGWDVCTWGSMTWKCGNAEQMEGTSRPGYRRYTWSPAGKPRPSGGRSLPEDSVQLTQVSSGSTGRKSKGSTGRPSPRLRLVPTMMPEKIL